MILNNNSVVWFSPTSIGLELIQESCSYYAWTSSVESLIENHNSMENSPVILFNLAGFQEESFEKINAITALLPQLPIIVIAGVDDVTLVEKAMLCGAHDFFLGPLNSSLLVHRMCTVRHTMILQESEALSTLEMPKNNNSSQEIELAFMAFYDELTGLANRKLLFSRLDDLLKINIPEGQHLALLYIDLDGFKEINDNFTHKAGDWLLQQVSVRLRHGVKKHDTVARVGGDEFCILLADPLTAHEASRIAQRIIYQLSSTYFYNHMAIKISASIGIAFYPSHARTGHELLNRADLSMYIAKQNGIGSYRIYTPEFEKIFQTMQKIG